MTKDDLMTFDQPTYSDAELEYFEDSWATKMGRLEKKKWWQFWK